MNELAAEFQLRPCDDAIDKQLSQLDSSQPDTTRYFFNQYEESFFDLPTTLIVPSLPIHHDVHSALPDERYLAQLRDIIFACSTMRPSLFAGLNFCYIPSEPLVPYFWKKYSLGQKHFLFLLKLDLQGKPFLGEKLAIANNNFTRAYRTEFLYFESELIPISEKSFARENTCFAKTDQLIEDTWIGETGRGYFVRGIWLDDDLSRFFTKLLASIHSDFYPFRPVFCKYKTICAQAIPIIEPQRIWMMERLSRIIDFVKPELPNIQKALKKNTRFSADLPIFQEMNALVPQEWKEEFSHFHTHAYLDPKGMKEFALHCDVQHRDAQHRNAQHRNDNQLDQD